MSSLKQIAAELGVSYSLVSKVLNKRLGTTGVSLETQEAIIKKAKELDYKPNRLAVALKSGRQGAIGVFLHHIGTNGSEINERLLKGISKGLEGSDCKMWLRFFMTEKEFLTACHDRLGQEIDGLIIAGVRHIELISKLQKIDKNGLPVVSIFSDLSPENQKRIDNLSVNWEEQGYLGTKHLIDQGCQKIATIHADGNRKAGYLRALKEHHMHIDPKRVIGAKDFSKEAGTLGIQELLKSKTPFDGIFIESDALAIGAINELVHLGIKVPETIKIVGVDNSPLADSCIVPITSVTPEMVQTGLEAVKLLLLKIEGTSVQSKTLSPKIVVRRSSQNL